MNQAYMKEKPIFPLLTSMALPMMLSMLVGSLYNIIDSYFVAKISEASMTALSLVFPVQNLINAVSVGFAIGINSAVAFYLGAGKQDSADTRCYRGDSAQRRPRLSPDGGRTLAHAGFSPPVHRR